MSKLIYELVVPVDYKMDTVSNGKKLIDDIKTYDEYYNLITRCITYNNKVILKEVMSSSVVNLYKYKLMNDDSLFYHDKVYTRKEFLINRVLRAPVDVELAQMVLDFFGVEGKVQSGEDYIYEDGELIDKNKNFYYVLDHFEEMTGVSLLVETQCIEEMKNKLNCDLTEEEIVMIKYEIQATKVRVFNMKQEMMNMTPSMYDEWLEWKTNANYHSYDSYTLNDKINIWNEFYGQYYESESESEYEQEETDYDY